MRGIKLGTGLIKSVVSASFGPGDYHPALWLDASDLTTIHSSGGAVDQWDDKSGNGFHLSMTPDTKRPITGTRTLKGLNVLDFDGVNDYLLNTNTALSLLVAQGVTIYAVCKADSYAANNQIVRFGVSGEFNLAYDGSGANIQGSHINTYAFSTLVVSPDTISPHILGLRRSAGGNVTTFRDDVLATSATATDTGAGNISIGARAAYGDLNFDGIIAEILILPENLSGAKHNNVMDYLMSKWIPSFFFNNINWPDGRNSVWPDNANMNWSE